MGYVIDKVGRPICFLVFLSLVTLGQCTFAISAHPSLNSFWLALAGRFLFGAFGKSVTGNLTIFVVTQSAYLSEWFKTRELALALGFVTCLSRSGTVLNFLVASKTLALSKSVGFALWVGTFLMLISVVSGLISLLIDQHVSIKSHYNPKQAKSRKVSLSDLKHFAPKFWLIVVSLTGYYIGFLCFVNISVTFAVTKFRLSRETAGMVAVRLN